MLLRLLEPGEHAPHRGHLERVRRDVLPADLVAVVVALVDLHLLVEPGDVRDVDLDRAVAQRLHELVRLELLVLGLVRVPDDDLVDVGLRELLRLDLVLLRRAEEVVEERHVELQDLDELDDAAVRDVELAVEVEGARVRVGAVLGDLPVVDVAGELGRVLVLLVLGLEGADADAVLLGEDEPAHAHVVHHLLPVALVLGHQLLEDEAAGGAEVARVRDGVARLGRRELGVDLGAPLVRDRGGAAPRASGRASPRGASRRRGSSARRPRRRCRARPPPSSSTPRAPS